MDKKQIDQLTDTLVACFCEPQPGDDYNAASALEYIGKGLHAIAEAIREAGNENFIGSKDNAQNISSAIGEIAQAVMGKV